MLAVAGCEQLPIQEARAGQPAAWDTLFRRYQLPLYSFVYELVANEQTALDIVQETFIRAVRYLGQLREDEKFGSWLFGIAHQQCVREWRKAGRAARATAMLSEEPVAAPEEPDEWLIRREHEARFRDLLGTLPEAHRSALVLHFLEEFSIEEIAQITGAAVGTVKSRIFYGKKALRALLEEKE